MSQTDVLNKQLNLFIRGTSTATECLPSLQYGLVAMKRSLYHKKQKHAKNHLLQSPRGLSVENMKQCTGTERMNFFEKFNEIKSEAFEKEKKMPRPKSYHLDSMFSQTNYLVPSSMLSNESPPNEPVLSATKPKVRKKQKSAKRKVRSADSSIKITSKKRNNLKKAALPSHKVKSSNLLRMSLPKSSDLLPSEITNKLPKPTSPERLPLPPPLKSTRSFNDKNIIKKSKLKKLENGFCDTQDSNILPTRIQLIHKFGNEDLLLKQQEEERQRMLAMKYKRKLNEMHNIEVKKQIQRSQIYALNDLMTRFENMQGVEAQSCIKV